MKAIGALKWAGKAIRMFLEWITPEKADLTYEEWLRLEFRAEHQQTNWKNYIR
jgi:hypothetical protein